MQTAQSAGKTALRMKAARMLVTWDWRIKTHSFERLYGSLGSYPIAAEKLPDAAISEIEDAVQFVSIWYWKRVLCLQRSCCLFWMLRDAGKPARLQIGAQHWPPRTHAWVNVEGRIVGDLPHKVQPFRLLDTI
jgi:Transglutaminase-like superfamily